MMEKSQKLLNSWLSEQDSVDGFLITKPENIQWLTGFVGSFGLFLQTKDNQKFLITDNRYGEKAEKLCQKNECKFVLFDAGFIKTFGKKWNGVLSLEDSISIGEQKNIQKWFPSIQIKTQSNVLENFRRTKRKDEIEKIKTAQYHVDKVLLPFLKSNVREGITEQELAFGLEIELRDKGKYTLSFDIIIAFGENSAVPHHAPSTRKLKSGDNILIDCGVKYEGYCSDMTRNFGFGSVSEEYKKAYEVLRKTQEEVLKSYRVGKSTQETESQCRELLGEQAEYFTHSLGHGVGLEIHELPRFGKKSKDIFQENEVVTCEPGLYYPEKFGIRIEDILIVTREDEKVISQTTKDLIIF